MKKKFLGFCLALVLIIPTIFLLNACGETNNYYYTIKTPENCVFEVSSFAADKEGNTYINKGREFEGQVIITPGYEVSGELVLKVNGKVVKWTTYENGFYYFSFTPTEDFDIVVEGAIIESNYEVRFMKRESADISNLFIRFEGEGEQLVEDFLNSANVNQNFKYNDNLKFYVYTKGYSAEPSVSIPGEFYKDETKNEYGYLYDITIAEGFDVVFDSLNPVSVLFATDVDTAFSSNEIDTEQLKMSISENNLIITFGNNITQETISKLTLTINGEVQHDISLVQGENTVIIKPAYEYVSEDGSSYNPYQYRIDLNFYNFAEFN